VDPDSIGTLDPNPDSQSFRCIFFLQFLVIKTLDPDWVRIHIGSVTGSEFNESGSTALPVGIEECLERPRKKRGGRGGLPAWRDSNDSDNTDQGDGGSGVSITHTTLSNSSTHAQKQGPETGGGGGVELSVLIK
jgi:hypothetical protein